MTTSFGCVQDRLYDPLYRLTNAVYSGDITTTIGYSYDAVGNRLTQDIDGVVTNYGYDNANRLTSVNGMAYTWDNNGNLLNDGVNTYVYDQANRLISVNGQTTFAYNGLGDRLRQTVGGVPTNYVNDPSAALGTSHAAGLTQVLSDGTNTYLYGAGRIAQQPTNQPTNFQYFGADGLGSVRQLYDTTGAALANKRYDPFGNVMSSVGAPSVYGYTGEQTDATGLIFLRARYLDPAQGRFTTRDVWEGDDNAPLTLNRWNYTQGNPVNYTDPSGFASGSEDFVVCFDLHSLRHGKSGQGVRGMRGRNDVTAQEAIDICKAAYTGSNWGFTLSPDLPQSANDLMGWYVNNYRGNYDSDRLYYDGNQPLTRELAQSQLVQQVRASAYDVGDTNDPTHLEFHFWEQIQSSLDAGNLQSTNPTLKGKLPISTFIGSFYYQVKIVDNGRRIGFRIDNETTLESGTHIAGRFNPEYYDNVENLIQNDPSLAKRPLYQLINDPQYHLISILRSRTRDEEKGGTLGGANLYQTFTWTEPRDECWANWWRWGYFLDSIDFQVWNGYESLTSDPKGFPPK